MSANDRARQFLPFDALKGLREALRLKEYEHERIAKRDIDEEKIKQISNTLSSIVKGDYVRVTYYRDGHYLHDEGIVKIDYNKYLLKIGENIIRFDDIYDIVIR
ncbi:MAG: YolD-like family protein [Acholeplasmatales bacterium]|nr:YolD-like family protein [Acholeplasmatales bacterium]